MYPLKTTASNKINVRGVVSINNDAMEGPLLSGGMTEGRKEGEGGLKEGGRVGGTDGKRGGRMEGREEGRGIGREKDRRWLVLAMAVVTIAAGMAILATLLVEVAMAMVIGGDCGGGGNGGKEGRGKVIGGREGESDWRGGGGRIREEREWEDRPRSSDPERPLFPIRFRVSLHSSLS
jgi:hypothetical protein